MTNTEPRAEVAPARLTRQGRSLYSATNGRDVLDPTYLSCTVYRSGREWEIRFFPYRVSASTGRMVPEESITWEAWSLRMARRIIARVFADYDASWSLTRDQVRELARKAFMAETDHELALLCQEVGQ